MEMIWIIVAAVVLLLGGVGAYFATRKKELPPTQQVEQPALEGSRPSTSPTAKGRLEAAPEQKQISQKAEPRGKALREGLGRTRSGFVGRLFSLLQGKKLDADLAGQLEEVLYTADIGPKTSTKLFEAVRQGLSRNELKDPDQVIGVLKQLSQEILLSAQAARPAIDLDQEKPTVILMIGVNGVGKTTTIGKLAQKWTQAGKKVLLAAGDTFRAAATEQLEVWGKRAGVPVVRANKEGADPSSVIFDAVKRAQAEGFDIVLADTAGRLHTKTNLMEELQKVRRVLQKAMPTAPHETFLVLDATLGQNALQQALLFKQAMDTTGIILTKLDGTAKGGVILGIADELRVPVRFIGIGEKADDLRPFDPIEFVGALFENAEAIVQEGAGESHPAEASS